MYVSYNLHRHSPSPYLVHPCSKLIMANINLPRNATYPPWLPSGFAVTNVSGDCPSTTHTLVSFAIYNCISIASFLLLGHSYLNNLLTRGPRAAQKSMPAWSIWSALAHLAFQLLGNVLTSLLLASRGYNVSVWQLMQLWALRPRTAWLLGNASRLKRQWGYANGALNQIFAEVFVAGLATVFLGRALQAAWTHSNYSNVVWWRVMVAASTLMLLSTGVEILWALWMLKRTLESRGRAEAADVDSMKWIAAFFVPVTALCSWLVWVAFLTSAEGFYCPRNSKYVDLIWGLVPIVTNITRQLLEGMGR